MKKHFFLESFGVLQTEDPQIPIDKLTYKFLIANRSQQSRGPPTPTKLTKSASKRPKNLASLFIILRETGTRGERTRPAMQLAPSIARLYYSNTKQRDPMAITLRISKDERKSERAMERQISPRSARRWRKTTFLHTRD